MYLLTVWALVVRKFDELDGCIFRAEQNYFRGELDSRGRKSNSDAFFFAKRFHVKQLGSSKCEDL